MPIGRRILIAVVCLAAAGHAGADEPAFPPLMREPLLESALPSSLPETHLVKAVRIRFAPGQPTGLHRHPVPVIGVVTAGTFVFAVEGKSATVLKAGDPFYEPAGARIERFDNASPNDPAEIVAYYLMGREDDRLIEMLDRGK